MARVAWGGPVYEAADLFRQRVLIEGTSFLWPEQDAWTDQNITAVFDALLTNTTGGTASFLGTLQSQLSGLSDDAVRVAADAYAFYWLFPRKSAAAAATKRKSVESIAAWRSDTMSMPIESLPLLDAAFEEGIGLPGQYFLLYQWEYLRFILAFARAIRRNEGNPHDPESCRLLVYKVASEEGIKSHARHVLLYLLFPDDFERTATTSQKQQIIAGFPQLADGDPDLDLDLRHIRLGLSARLGVSDLDFYEPSIRVVWDKDFSPSVSNPQEDQSAENEASKAEILSKIRRRWRADARNSRIVAERLMPDAADRMRVLRFLANVIEAANGASSAGWSVTLTETMIRLNTSRNYTMTIDLKNIQFSIDVTPPFLEEILAVFQAVDATLNTTGQSFVNVPGSLSTRLPHLAFVHNADRLSDPVVSFAVRSAGTVKSRSQIWDTHSPGVVQFLNEVCGRTLSQPSYVTDWHFPEGESIVSLLGRLPSPEDLATETHLPIDELNDLIDLLDDKKQIILEGPPGSGKTWVADRLARYLTGSPFDGHPNEQVELVQFHQSYGYEDFVQGIRPITDTDGHIQYRVLPGIFTRFCRVAEQNPDKPFVLIIDEINRGNLSRIFGELLLLLEYRDRRVRLPYGAGSTDEADAYLTIPDNLRLIGTMNTADRSLAQIDYALRRRFYFHRLLPLDGDTAPVLRSWLATQDIDTAKAAQIHGLFVALNRKIADELGPDSQVGHSYFMRADIGEEAGLDRVWRRAVLPLIEEYVSGARDHAETMAGYDRVKLTPPLTTAMPVIAGLDGLSDEFDEEPIGGAGPDGGDGW